MLFFASHQGARLNIEFDDRRGNKAPSACERGLEFRGYGLRRRDILYLLGMKGKSNSLAKSIREFQFSLRVLSVLGQSIDGFDTR
jgi:hypothetical protein